jgi:hypothetical protein
LSWINQLKLSSCLDWLSSYTLTHNTQTLKHTKKHTRTYIHTHTHTHIHTHTTHKHSHTQKHTHAHVKYKMTVDELSVDEMTIDKMSRCPKRLPWLKKERGWIFTKCLKNFLRSNLSRKCHTILVNTSELKLKELPS